MSQDDITYESVARSINAQTGLSFDEIAKRVTAIEASFTGLLTRVGAALVMAEKLGVKAYPEHENRGDDTNMSESNSSAAKALGLAVDESRKFATTGKGGAGRCEKCGFWKTWETKVRNEKSGKDMPGHVTSEGFKIGNGDCPFYTLAQNMRGKLPTAAATAPQGSISTPAERAGTPFTFGKKTETVAVPAGKDWYPLLVKVVKVLVKKEVDPAGTGVEFTPEEQKDLQPIIEGA